MRCQTRRQARGGSSESAVWAAAGGAGRVQMSRPEAHGLGGGGVQVGNVMGFLDLVDLLAGGAPAHLAAPAGRLSGLSLSAPVPARHAYRGPGPAGLCGSLLRRVRPLGLAGAARGRARGRALGGERGAVRCGAADVRALARVTGARAHTHMHHRRARTHTHTHPKRTTSAHAVCPHSVCPHTLTGGVQEKRRSGPGCSWLRCMRRTTETPASRAGSSPRPSR